MVALVLDGLVGFPASLSPTSFHLSPSSFHLSPSSFHLFPPRLGACGRVPGSPFISLPVLFTCLPILSFASQAGCLWSGSFVSHFFSFVSQAGCLWWGSVPGWLVSHFLSFSALVLGFPAGLSPTSLNVSPTSFHLSPGWVLVVGFPALLSFLSQFFSLVSQFFHLSPRLGACGRVHLSPTSFHLSLRLGACGGVRFPAGLSPTSFHSRRLRSGSRPASLPLP